MAMHPSPPYWKRQKKRGKYRKYECNFHKMQTENPQSCPMNLLAEKLAEILIYALISTPASLAAAKNDLSV